MFKIIDACVCVLCSVTLSHVRLFTTPWTAAYQAPLSMEFSRQEYWSGLPLPHAGDLPNPGIKPSSPASEGGIFTTEPAGKPQGLFPSFTTANHPSPLGGATMNAASHPLLNLPVSPTQSFCLGELLSDSVVWQEQTQHSHLSSVWGSLSWTSWCRGNLEVTILQLTEL